jgi:hypothetical protein
MTSSADSPPVVGRPPRTRSRISNGRALFDEGVDGRGSWPRRLRDLLQLHVSDLGGEDIVTAAERSIIRRVATISVELELLEKKFALGDGAAAADLALYLTAANTLRRLLEAVGLKRVARDVSTLSDYLKKHDRNIIDADDTVDDDFKIEDTKVSP